MNVQKLGNEDVPKLGNNVKKCPNCNSEEIDSITSRTVYSCGSSDFNQTPDSFMQSDKCKQNDVREDDVEKLAKERYPEYYSIGLGGDRIGFERGYQLAKENTYTEEQVREAIDMAKKSLYQLPKQFIYSSDQIIQSLKQPK